MDQGNRTHKRTHWTHSYNVCNILGEISEATDPNGSLNVVKQISRLRKETALEHRIDYSKLALAIVGAPGVPDRKTGHILLAPNIKGINQINFAEELTSEMGITVQVENDVNLAVLGEHWVGCGADIYDLAYVAVGTGIGAGLMIDGNLVRGAVGSAGELGYQHAFVVCVVESLNNVTLSGV